MKRNLLIGLGVVAGIVGLIVLGREQIAAMTGRLTGRAEVPTEKQWPFDGGELQSLMGRIVSEQQAIVANAETPAERERAAAFQRYYEGRLAAAR